MAQVINTNAMSLNAQRNLNTSSSSLATSIQRLSSGMRINSAKDDAAGLAISERFTTQIRGLDVATRNANDGISLAQTAEGAMVEISNNLQRVRELAVQSANATNSESDRKALQSEVNQLTAEIDRVAKQTNFNGTSLLDGSLSGALFQIGADAGQTIGINSILDAQTASLGSTTFKTGSIAAIATPTANGGGKFDVAAQVDFKINGVDIKGFDAKEYDTDTAAVSGRASDLAAAINAKSGETSVIAEAQTDGSVKLTQFIGDAAITSATVTVTAGTDATEKVSDLDITTFAGAQKAMQIADSALGQVNSARAEMGAIQNRFSSTIANLSSTSENLSASRSRIRDTDYAKETAELTRTQILQQAGTAMLSQANSSTQSVLSLLG
ncbi:flagellin [Stenotrophomonas sp. W1S232]|uniref:Flagellin n=1 Tax=Stenotrophomonas koreensis TaxID=266128 RepID=A0A7W3V1U6_9GAMM|nr:flagellin [Stenotrophomonas koreensis]MBB1117958.1 flagellin [Stenotrophomonas koreensis]